MYSQISRRGFSFAPLAALLAVLLIAILVWKVSFQRGLVPPTHPRAAAIKQKITWNAASVVIVTSILSSLVGVGCYFVFRRSSQAAAAGVSATIALPLTFLSIQVVRTYAGPPPTQPATTTTNPPSASPPGSTQAFLERTREQLERQNQRTLDTARNLQRPTPPPPSTSPAAPPPSSTPTPPPPSTQPPAPRTNPPAPKAPSPASTLAMEKLENDLKSQASDLTTTLDPILSRLAKVPRADRADLRKRIDDAQASHDALTALSQRLRNISDEARQALSSAGSDNAPAEASRFAMVINAHQRAFACDNLGRTLDNARQEAQFLLDNFGQWKVGRDGKIESKDFQLQSRANSNRFFIDAWMRNKDSELSKIRGE